MSSVLKYLFLTTIWLQGRKRKKQILVHKAVNNRVNET